jgi:hypothetical protein
MGLFDMLGQGAGLAGTAGVGAALAGPTMGASMIPAIISALGGMFGGLGGQPGQRRSFQGAGTPQQQTLTDPVNALYNQLHSMFQGGQAVADRLRQPTTVPGASVGSQAIHIPGLPFQIGGMQGNVKPMTFGGLNLPPDFMNPNPTQRTPGTGTGNY